MKNDQQKLIKHIFDLWKNGYAASEMIRTSWLIALGQQPIKAKVELIQKLLPVEIFEAIVASAHKYLDEYDELYGIPARGMIEDNFEEENFVPRPYFDELVKVGGASGKTTKGGEPAE